jgi:hypothetical protein
MDLDQGAIQLNDRKLKVGDMIELADNQVLLNPQKKNEGLKNEW